MAVNVSGDVEDWQLNKSALESHRYMLEKQLYCDVTFTFKSDNEENENSISAHKLILLSRSPVFEAMFEGPMKETTNRITIEDVEKDVFMEMLRYIYYDEVNLSQDNIITVLYCAKKYTIQGLAAFCRKSFEKTLTPDNAFAMLEKLFAIDEGEVCLQYIDERPLAVFESESFTQIETSTLEAILKRDTLRVEEIDVYNAVVRWAEAECERKGVEVHDENKRNALGDALFAIRFPTLDVDTFVKSVLTSGILLPEESVGIMLSLKGESPRRPLLFPCAERRTSWVEDVYEDLQVHWHDIDQNSKRHYEDEYKIKVDVKVKGDWRQVLISSVYFTQMYNRRISSLTMQGAEAKDITRRPDKDVIGFNDVYEAKFQNPLSITSGGRIVFNTRYDYSVPHFDCNSIDNKYFSFKSPDSDRRFGDHWCYIVGLKYKIRG